MNTEGHAFIGIELPRNTLAAIDGVQRTLIAAARHAGGRAELIPRRLLVLPLEDLGPLRPETLEAVELAVDRTCRKSAPFTVQLGRIDAAPAHTPTIARILIEDDRDRLATLRADLHAALTRYGFALEPGIWRPHLPIARLEGIDALPPIDAPRLGPVRVDRLVVFRRDPTDARGARFRPALLRPLGQPDTHPAPTAADIETHRAEIATQLAARLDQRRQQLDEDPGLHRARRPRRRAS